MLIPIHSESNTVIVESKFACNLHEILNHISSSESNQEFTIVTLGHKLIDILVYTVTAN